MPLYIPRLIAGQPFAVIRSADMTLTTDQAFTNLGPFPARWVLRRAVARWISGAFGVACAGGIYTAASKAGTAIVAAAQTYTGLTGANTVTDASVAAVAVAQTSTTLFLSLTTGNTGALVADIYLFGDQLT